MKCLHCRVEFHSTLEEVLIGNDADGAWAIHRYCCPACNRMNLFLVNGDLTAAPVTRRVVGIRSSTPVRPRCQSRPPCPAEVPRDIAEDYEEACLVLDLSTKASAALSRRCLQNLLRHAAGVKHGDLSKEIQQVIDAKVLPSHLSEVIDAVRQIGNFAAHPMKSQSSGQILPVERCEAEWNLDVLEALFDFYYVQPAIVAAKRERLDKKLKEAGKLPMK